MFQLIAQAVASVLAGAVLATSSCITVVNTPPTGEGGSGGGGTPTTITVRFVNDSLWAVDPQFYATAAALGDPEVMLFLQENQITAGIGFAGSGLIPAAQSDEVTLDCTNATTIGTRGGRFVDQDTGAEKGTGERRVASIQLSYGCGDTITLTYHANGEVFTTGLQVE